MKVLLANKFFFVNGGSEVVFFQERDFLHRSGVQVVDFSMADARNLPSPFESLFVTNRTYKGETSLSRRLKTALDFVHCQEAVSKIGRLLDQEKPSIVHCHNIYHQLTPSIIGAAKRRGIPVVLTAHDYKAVCPTYLCLRNGEICSECIDFGFGRVLSNRCADGSMGKSALLYAEAVVQRLLGSYEMLDGLFAPSDFLGRLLTKKRFPSERVHVLRNGIDVENISPSASDGQYVLFFGRLSHEKGVKTLLQAYQGIASDLPLVIAGTGPLEQALKVEFPFASFLGHVTGNRLKDVIGGAAIVVVPSEWYENCPMSILEAMAYGRPVVASRIGGIPELVIHGETGFLFDPGDKGMLQEQLALLGRDVGMRRMFGAAARRRVEEHFSLKIHNDSLLKLYSQVLA